MPLRKSDLMLRELTDFLDSLPKEPCDSPPTTRYFCTVCERLNKSVERRCTLYSSRVDAVGLGKEPGEFKELGAEGKGVEKPGSDESVEFKVVGDSDSDSDEERPLFEIVKPAEEDMEPLEMTLLEDEAIEFELMGGDGDEISEDAIEVEPLEVEEYEGDGIEVEPLEVEEYEDDFGGDVASDVAVAPKPKVSVKSKPKAKAKAKTKTKTVSPAKPGKVVSAPKPVAATPEPVKKTTTPVVPSTKPVAAKPKPVPAAPAPKPQPSPAVSNVISEVEEQLVVGMPCTICGSKLTNAKFCTQCGGKVEFTATGIRTVPRE